METINFLTSLGTIVSMATLCFYIIKDRVDRNKEKEDKFYEPFAKVISILKKREAYVKTDFVIHCIRDSIGYYWTDALESLREQYSENNEFKKVYQSFKKIYCKDLPEAYERFKEEIIMLRLYNSSYLKYNKNIHKCLDDMLNKLDEFQRMIKEIVNERKGYDVYKELKECIGDDENLDIDEEIKRIKSKFNADNIEKLSKAYEKMNQEINKLLNTKEGY